jgi:hypothetical protein
MRRMGHLRKRWIAAALVALPASAFAQLQNYDVKTMNFDLWCQEQQHLDPDRCDKRLPGDEKDFDAYRATIERYEIPYLQEKQNAVTLDRDILNKDPVDNPVTQDAQSQPLQQQRSQTIDPRTPRP